MTTNVGIHKIGVLRALDPGVKILRKFARTVDAFIDDRYVTIEPR